MQRPTQRFNRSIVTGAMTLAAWMAFAFPVSAQMRGATGGGGGATGGGGLVGGGGLSGGLGGGGLGGGTGSSSGSFSLGGLSGGLSSGFSLGGTGTGTGGTGGSGLPGGLGGNVSGFGATGGGGRLGGGVSYGTNTFLGPNYGNPLSLGMQNANGKATFGRVLYTTTTTSTATTGTGTASVTRSSTSTTNASGYGIRRAPAYTASLGFPARPMPASAVLAEVQDALARSTRLPSRAAIRVVMDGRVLVLQGTVQDEHERRLAESIVRLTPGTRDVRNELNVREATPPETPIEP